LQVQTVKKDEYDKKIFKKGRNNSKGGNWSNSKGKNKVSDRVESSNEGSSGNYQGKKKGFDKKKMQCYNFEKFGHYASECWSSKGKQVKNEEEHAKLAQEDSDSNTVLLMVTTTSNENCNFEKWFLDIGCFNHMTCNNNWLIEIDTGRNTKVKLVHHRTLVVEGMLKIAIEG